MLRRRSASLTLLALLLAGCGGSGTRTKIVEVGSGSGEKVGPRIALAWPARARDFAAPAYAGAARIVFPNSGANSADATQVVNRPAGDAAVSQNVLLDFAVAPGVHLVRVEFLADASNSVPLATASLNVDVQRDGVLRNLDGSPLGTVAYTSKITGLSVAADQSVDTGGTANLVVTATAPGGVVALPAGAVRYAVVSGGEFATVDANGVLTGVAPGTATVTASIEGVTSAPATVTVLPAPLAARVVSLATADLVADPTGARLWAALPAGSANGSAVASVDPATGAVGNRIAVGGDPSVIAVSDDGSTLYAGLKDVGTVRKVNLTTQTAGAQFALAPVFGSAGYALDIAVQPGHPNTIGLTSQDFNDSGNVGPQIYDDGVKRPNNLFIYDGTNLVWTSPSRIITYTNYTTDDALRDVAVDANGAQVVRTARSGLNTFSTRLTLVGDRLYDRYGVVFDATSLSRVGAFTLPGQGNFNVPPAGPAVDLAANRAYFVQAQESGLRLVVFDATTFELRSIVRIGGVSNPVPAPIAGAHSDLLLVGGRLVLRLSGQVVIIDDVSGL